MASSDGRLTFHSAQYHNITLGLLRPIVAEELADSVGNSFHPLAVTEAFAASISALSALVFSHDRQYSSGPIPLGFLAPLTRLSYLAMSAHSGPGPPFHDPAFYLRLSIGMIGRMAKSLPIAKQRLIELTSAAEAMGVVEKDEIWAS